MDALDTKADFHTLKTRLIKYGFLNLLIVALIGFTLRSFPFFNVPLNYGYLLHGHSHFAFGGWLMPVIVWLILEFFPSVAMKTGFHHWRNISIAILASAYGMLASFPFQGYGAVSIVFSTLAVFAGFYMAFVLIRVVRKEKPGTALLFLFWGLIYMILSSIGPFATGPLVALGKQGSTLYYDAIYFYLHFQYNGWFVFMVLAVLYQLIGEKAKHGKPVFYLLNVACLPVYFLSILWNHPPVIFYWVGGLGALLQLIAVYFLLIDFQLLNETNRFVRTVLTLVMIGFVIKSVLQFLSAIPFFANMAYQRRNLVIAYLHLVLLGFVSLFVMAMVMRSVGNLFKRGLIVFIAGYLLTEVLIVAGAFGFYVAWWLLALSGLLVLGAMVMALAIFFKERRVLNHRDRATGRGHRNILNFKYSKE